MKRNDFDRLKSEVYGFIDKHINEWLEIGYTPCLKTFIKMEQAVFVDVRHFEFVELLSKYCSERDIFFQGSVPKKVDRKKLMCFLFTRNNQ